MRDNFIFYKSFYDAINLLGEKAQLKLYKAIMKMNFNCCENVTEIEQLCSEIETELKQNRHVFAQFLLLKPHLLNSAKQHYKGLLGGAPKGNKNAKKNNQIEIEKEREEEYNIPPISPQGEIASEEKFLSDSNFVEKPIDFYAEPLIEKCFDTYERLCPDLCKLRFERRSRNLRELTAKFLTEIDRDVGVIEELCRKANALKQIVDKPIDYEKMLKCYQGILNGKYKETGQGESREDIVRRLNARFEEEQKRGKG